MSNENQLYYSFWEFSWNTHLEISSVKMLLTYLLLQWHGHIMSYISSRKWIHVCTLALIAICVWDLWDTKHANCCIAHPLLLHNGSKTVFKTHFDFWKHLQCTSFNFHFDSLFDLEEILKPPWLMGGHRAARKTNLFSTEVAWIITSKFHLCSKKVHFTSNLLYCFLALSTL